MEEFDNGKKQKVTEIRTKRNAQQYLYDHYYKRKKRVVEYYESGKIKSFERDTYLNATWGRKCNSVLYLYKTYYPNGALKTLYKEKCDQRKIIDLEYSENGHKISRTITRNYILKDYDSTD